MDPLLLTPGQAADLLSVHRATVYRLMDRGELPVVNLGGRRMIHHRRLVEQIDDDASVNNAPSAPGVIHRSEPCRTKGPAYRNGGPPSPGQEAARRLEELLELSTRRKPRQ